MIVTIIIVSLAFAWLLKESRFLTIRLKYDLPQSKSDGLLPSGNSKGLPEYEPTVFIPADIPAMTGDNNILCEVIA